MLSALRGICNLPVRLRLPAPARALLAALAASFLLHAGVFDFWRGRVQARRAEPARPRLQVQLQQTLRPPAELPPARVASQVAQPELRLPVHTTAPQRQKKTPAASPVRPALATASREAALASGRSEPLAAMVGVERPVQQTASLVAEPGLRPLSTAEGRVAYRLALLEHCSAPPLALGEGGVRLGLQVDAQGQPVAVSVDSVELELDARLSWQRWLEQAARLARVPEVLLGQAFSLELELRP